jgi:hypothetical protein
VLDGVAATLLLWWAVRVLKWALWAPSGLNGTRYRFLWGDIKRNSVLRRRPWPGPWLWIGPTMSFLAWRLCFTVSSSSTVCSKL